MCHLQTLTVNKNDEHIGPGLGTAAAGRIAGAVVAEGKIDIDHLLEPATVPAVGTEVRSPAVASKEIESMAAGTCSAGGIEIAVAVAVVGLATMAADTVVAGKRQA